ncbi:hypothetical protein EV702DRAFT_577364 [Suillus placidus]|uniref:F-box domain-containing protein n=1 Tax=Suillus placidus TaxID=48579 RepID=A0A9P6ZNB7_9AGAM|nr:hypothetical protein EV702DRAFT_577364 [Suillus placidus]
MPIRFIDTSRKDNLTVKPTLISSYQESHHGIVQSTSLLDIPAESLTHITSFLSPPSLLALSRTNRRFNEHINDDNTWYRAFINQFLGIGPENDLENERILLLRKSERTWRKEFIMRHNLRGFVDMSHIQFCSYLLSQALGTFAEWDNHSFPSRHYHRRRPSDVRVWSPHIFDSIRSSGSLHFRSAAKFSRGTSTLPEQDWV